LKIEDFAPAGFSPLQNPLLPLHGHTLSEAEFTTNKAVLSPLEKHCGFLPRSLEKGKRVSLEREREDKR
jgi:hypothetical protein